MAESVKGLVLRHLGRKVDARLLLANILAVDRGIKRAYLYDLGTPDAYKLSRFLIDLSSTGILHQALNIIEIGMDCVIVNAHEMKVNDLNQIQEKFVDVSKRCEGPRILDSFGKEVIEVKSAFYNICNCLDSGKMTVAGESDCPKCNISSLFGLLLNYPVVYWYDTSNGESENCLANEKLTVVKIQVRVQPKEKKCPELHAVFGNCYDFSLFQFSYPSVSVVEKECRPIVRLWSEHIKERISKVDLFSEPQITFREEILDAVVL